MILYEFEHERPASLEQACATLRNLGDGARVIAGGTALFPNMRVGNERPRTVVSLSALEALPPERTAAGEIRIDALMRLAAMERSTLLQAELPMLVLAASVVGSAQIRYMATLGGNLCQDTRCLQFNQKHDYQFAQPCYKRGGEVCFPYPNNGRGVCWSVYSSDIAPALMALDARLEIVGADGAREMPVDALFTGNGLAPLALRGDEIVRAVVVGAPRPGSGWGYGKLARRGGLEYAMAVVAVALQFDPASDLCVDARVVVGAVRERPLRVEQAEKALVGTQVDGDAIAVAVSATATHVNPLPHHGFSKAGIRDELRVRLREVLGEAAARARGHAQPDGGKQ